MAGSLSIDLRKRAVAEYRKGGMTYADVAEQFSVGEATVNRWLRLERETGDLAPRSRPGRRPKVDAEGLELLHRLVLKRPDATLAELCSQYHEHSGVQVCITTVHRALERLNLSRKKKRFTPPSKSART